jgi:hypothetical protein
MRKFIIIVILLGFIMIGCRSVKLEETYSLGISKLRILEKSNRFVQYDQGELSVIGYSEGHYLINRDTLFLISNPIDSSIQIIIDTTQDKRIFIHPEFGDDRLSIIFILNDEKNIVNNNKFKEIKNIDSICLFIKVPFPRKAISGSCFGKFDTLYANKTIRVSKENNFGLNITVKVNLNYFNYLPVRDSFIIKKSSLVEIANHRFKYRKTTNLKNLDSTCYFNYCMMP